ncbi:leucine-rich repeat domain-containing protein [uncultured Porphyromonas sp.]|uniref:InlB B-repeat-containing protein n=1 Tax=uncultured Porphyromonas sp. TaxID=159274 RepID=UPI00260EA7A4|nr:leucine-rich repeat domain-containing protein [uncultured Porphyromonas sp.]
MTRRLHHWACVLLCTLLTSIGLQAEESSQPSSTTSDALRTGSDGVITMTTTKAVGEKITLEIWGGGITIEGVKEPFSRGSATYTLTSQTVIIRGDVTELKGWNNQLTNLDVSGCTILTSLKCFGNKLTSLDVSGCTALTELKCYDNQLTSLNVSGCTALTTLECFNNKLTSLDVSGYTALTILNCYENQLTSLNVSKNTALTTLKCSENQLTMLDVSKNTALTKLECHENQLTSLDVSKNTALTWLNCYHNKLTALDVSQNTALTNLVCQQNQLTALDVSQNTALTKLVCAENKLATLDVSQNTALKILACGENPLTALDVSQNIALTQLICDNNQLTALDVSQNTALTWLDCDRNQLTALEVSQNTALTYLYCRRNQLTALDVSQNTALKELYCSNNQLKALDVSKNTELGTLHCHGNQIKGEEMTRLVNSLPDRTGKRAGKFTVVQEPAPEGNICLKSDVAIAKGKNWNTLKYKSNTQKYVAYEGEEETQPLKVTLTKEGEGTLTATGATDLNAVPYGTELTIKATPAEGYELTALTANGTDILATKKLSVKEDTEIKATFTKKKNYTVTFTKEGEGTLTATRNGAPFTSGSTAREGDKIIFTAQPATGYKVDKWLLSEAEIELTPYTGLATFECTVGTADVLIKTTFVQQTFTVTLTSNEHGTISIVENVDLKAVPYGTTLTVQATGKNDQCELTALTANGEDILATKKFVVKGATEVKATFVDHTNIAEVNTEAIRFYPNPAREYIIVEGTLPATLVTLYSMEGMRLYEDETDAEGTLRIDLSAYAEGTYLLRIADQTHRIIVQH